MKLDTKVSGIKSIEFLYPYKFNVIYYDRFIALPLLKHVCGACISITLMLTKVTKAEMYAM